MSISLSNSKNKLNYYNYQVLNGVRWNSVDPQPTSPYMIGMILACNDSVAKILNVILILKKRYINRDLHPRHETLAKMAGVSLASVKRALEILKNWGLLATLWRGYNKSLLYKVSSWFNDQSVQEQLSKKLSIFYYAMKSYLSVSLLMSYDVFNVFNFIYKNKHVLNVNTSTYEEEEYQIKNKGRESRSMLEKIKKELGLGEYEISQLSIYSEKILKEAYIVLYRSKNVANKFRFLLGICKNLEAKANNKPVPTQPKVVKVENKVKGDYEKEMTAVQIAEELSKLNKIDASKMYGGEGFKEVLLRNWAWKDYVPTSNETETIALMYIDTYRKRFNLEPRITIKNEQISTTTNETDLSICITQQKEKDSTLVKFEPNFNFDENSDLFEEVYD